MAKVKVGINGYGVIGKRIADAVKLQEDMELVGVTARTPDFRLFPAKKAGINIYGVDGDSCDTLMKAGVQCKGDLSRLLGEVDVIVDATPKDVGEQNKEKYDEAGVKSIFQGGEKHELTDFSFVAQVNYEHALGKQSARVVSCNTTAICRILYPFVKASLLEKAYVALARRGVDPIDAHGQGPLGTVVPEEEIPSHQASDAQKVIPELPVLTMAAAVPTTLGHLHMVFLRFKKEVLQKEILHILSGTSRLVPIRHKEGLVAQNLVVELMRDLGRPRADMWEVAFWQDCLYSKGREAAFYYQVHNEAIVIPENIDAIRALSGIEKDPEVSIAKTNASLGIVSGFSQE